MTTFLNNFGHIHCLTYSILLGMVMKNLLQVRSPSSEIDYKCKYAKSTMIIQP